MYIKLFESRQSKRSFIIRHDISIRGLDHGVIHIEDEDKARVSVGEDELFHLVDEFLKSKLKKG